MDSANFYVNFQLQKDKKKGKQIDVFLYLIRQQTSIYQAALQTDK